MGEKKSKLERIVGFRLSNEDYATYSAKVAASGKSPSEYFRDCVLENTTQLVINGKALSIAQMERRARAAAILVTKKSRSIKNDNAQQLLFIFNKASNNLNQLAKRANADHVRGILSEESYVEFLQNLQHIQRTMRGV